MITEKPPWGVFIKLLYCIVPQTFLTNPSKLYRCKIPTVITETLIGQIGNDFVWEFTFINLTRSVSNAVSVWAIDTWSKALRDVTEDK